MIIMALGDCHGDRGFTKKAITWAAENGVDRLVQVGDFGYWPRVNNGQQFLHDIGKHSHQLTVPFHWIDGNHEDHLMINTSLRAREKENGLIWHGKYPIAYIDRGTRWEWGGVWFGAFGGAFSIDRAWRTENSGAYGWFKEETPDRSKIEQLGKVDVLFTHDSPSVPPIVWSSGGQNFKNDETSKDSQAAVHEAMEASRPDLLIHGHWHVWDRYRVGNVTVQALAMNQNSLYSAAVVFDTDDRRLYNLREWEHKDD